MPVILRNVDVYKLIWKAPAYHSVMQILHSPLYAGAYAARSAHHAMGSGVLRACSRSPCASTAGVSWSVTASRSPSARHPNPRGTGVVQS